MIGNFSFYTLNHWEDNSPDAGGGSIGACTVTYEFAYLAHKSDKRVQYTDFATDGRSRKMTLSYACTPRSVWGKTVSQERYRT